jgi:phage gp36-like protein
VTQYATIAQLYQYGLPQTSVAGIVDDATLNAELESASEVADDYIRGRGQLPLLTPYPTSFIQKVCHVAAYNIMRNRGFSPTAGADATIKEAYYEAIGYPDRPGSGWLPAVQRQAIHPAFIFSAPNTIANGYRFPSVNSQPSRGWQRLKGVP